MNRKIVIYSSAARDFTESLKWYADRSQEAGIEFDREFDRTLGRISEHPEDFPKVDNSNRFCLMRKFPFQIIFRCVDQDIHVVAVAHTSRAPTFWSDR